MPLPQPSIRRSIVALAALVLAMSWLVIALPTAAQTPSPARTSLAGQLLVASPAMADPRFEHSVILMVKHDENGAFGIAINRPIAERPWSELLAVFGEADVRIPGTVPVFLGGPVQLELAFLIHSTDYRGPGTTDINDRVAMSSQSRHSARDRQRQWTAEAPARFRLRRLGPRPA